MAKVTKAQLAIRCIRENKDKDYETIVKLLMEAIDVDEKNARNAYRFHVRKDPTLGSLPEKSQRAPKAAKAPKVTKVKVPAPRVAGDREKANVRKDLTVEEMNDIKAKNMARMKAVTQKYADGRSANGASGRIHTDAEARAEVEKLEDSLDSFSAPKFLKLEDVKALV